MRNMYASHERLESLSGLQQCSLICSSSKLEDLIIKGSRTRQFRLIRAIRLPGWVSGKTLLNGTVPRKSLTVKDLMYRFMKLLNVMNLECSTPRL